MLTKHEINGRDCLFYTPSSVPSGAGRTARVRQLPLVIALHGGLGNAKSIMDATGFNSKADLEEFCVAYPEGTEGIGPTMKNRRTWNASGKCCGVAVTRGIDDVGWLTGVVSFLSAKYPIDLTRVYVTGMSNGAMMGYALANGSPGLITAVASVAGALLETNLSSFARTPVLHIHGKKDDNIPIAGGKGPASEVIYPSLEVTLDLLLASRGEYINNPSKFPIGNERFVYDCTQGAQVEVILHNGGHVWPDTMGMYATEQVWSFFRRFPHREPGQYPVAQRLSTL